jgi:hypothetical protein
LIGGVVESFADDIVNGSIYREGDLKIGIPAANLMPHDIVPIPTDIIIVDSENYNVLSVSTEYVGGAPVLYRLHCRGVGSAG